MSTTTIHTTDEIRAAVQRFTDAHDGRAPSAKSDAAVPYFDREPTNLPAPKIRLLGSRVLILPSEADEKSAGGIHIPETARRGLPQGMVIAAGPGRQTDDGTTVPLEVSAGDLVMYGRHAGTEVTIDGTKYRLMDEGDIFGVLG